MSQTGLDKEDEDVCDAFEIGYMEAGPLEFKFFFQSGNIYTWDTYCDYGQEITQYTKIGNAFHPGKEERKKLVKAAIKSWLCSLDPK